MSHAETDRSFSLDTDARILVVDVETGGFDPNNESILSIGAVEWSRDRLGNSIELHVTEQEIVMSRKSAQFNAALLQTVLTKGIAPVDAAQRFEDFLGTTFGSQRKQIVACGHNVWFDVSFLKRLYRLAGADYGKSFHHRTLDIQSIALWLVMTNRLSLPDTSSDSLLKHFNAEPPPDQRHTALADAIAEAKVLSALFSLSRDSV